MQDMAIAFSLRSFPIVALFLLSSYSILHAQTAGRHQTRNVIIVMSDGLRWQEVFKGADASLLANTSGGITESILGDRKERTESAKKDYLRPTTGKRREALMPFLWNTIARSGQLLGNRDLGSSVVVTNGLNISYPGYSEALTGTVDPQVASNEKNPNPGQTVLEWLHRKPEFHGRIAAFGAWDAFSAIFNSDRCGFPVNSGYAPFNLLPNNTVIEALNRLKVQGPRIWAEEPFDAVPFYTALEYLKAEKPRLLFIGLGETDDWAHANDYPEYLAAVHRADEFLRVLWATVQAMPEYRESTTLIVTADHGRGRGANWTSHGKAISESREIWMAVMGPDTPPLGERRNSEELEQTQLAPAIAALVGEDFHPGGSVANNAIEEIFQLNTREPRAAVNLRRVARAQIPMAIPLH
jgi:hypothetical protein